MLQNLLADFFSNKVAMFSLLGISSLLSGASILANYMDLKITINREKDKKKGEKETVADEAEAEIHQTEERQTSDPQTIHVEAGDDHANDVEMDDAQISDPQVNGMQMSSARMGEIQETMLQSRENFDRIVRENEKLRRMLLVYQVQAIREKKALDRFEDTLEVQDYKGLLAEITMLEAMIPYLSKNGTLTLHDESLILPKRIKVYKKMQYKRIKKCE